MLPIHRGDIKNSSNFLSVVSLVAKVPTLTTNCGLKGRYHTISLICGI